jgi:hypothetical protein
VNLSVETRTMNIFLLIHPRLLRPLKALFQSVAPSPVQPARLVPLQHSAVAIDSIAKQSLAEIASRRRPLRVVRILESGQPAAQVGRMVISGRMADVCAELDRLVACEAARH